MKNQVNCESAPALSIYKNFDTLPELKKWPIHLNTTVGQT